MTANTRRIYLDQAATSFPKPECVIEAMVKCMREAGGNPGRSGHMESLRASRVLLEAREELGALVNSPDSSRIALCFNATDALNMAIKGVLRPGDHVVTTSMEHNSVIRPLSGLAARGVISFTMVPGLPDGRVPARRIAAAIRPETRLVVVTHASNVTGGINPVAEIGAITRNTDALLLVDAAQTIGVVPIDVQQMGIDMLAFGGHKGLLGPQGTGGLYVNTQRAKLMPWREGGTGSRSDMDLQPTMAPDLWEAGTANTPGIAGLIAAVRYITSAGIPAMRQYEIEMASNLRDGLRQIGDDVTVYGPSDAALSTGVVSFGVRGWDPARLALALEDNHGIVSRPGLHCAPHAHRTIGTFPEGTVRFSLGWQNSAEDVAAAVEAVSAVIRS